MNVAEFQDELYVTFPKQLKEGAESPDLARSRELTHNAVHLHVALAAGDGEVTSDHIDNLIHALHQIFSPILRSIDAINEMYGDVIRPIDRMKCAIDPSRQPEALSQVQSLYAESLDHHSDSQTPHHFGEMPAGAGATDMRGSA